MILKILHLCAWGVCEKFICGFHLFPWMIEDVSRCFAVPVCRCFNSNLCWRSRCLCPCFLLLAKLLSFLVGYSDSICRYLMVDQCFSRCFSMIFPWNTAPRKNPKGRSPGSLHFFLQTFWRQRRWGCLFFFKFLDLGIRVKIQLQWKYRFRILAVSHDSHDI